MAPGLGYVFASACGYGCADMDVGSFRGLCDECGLLDEGFTASDVDEVYVAALPADPGGSTRHLDLRGFEAALSLLAERRGIEVREVLAAVLGTGGPRMHRASTDSGFCEASRAPWSNEAASPATASRAEAAGEEEEVLADAEEADGRTPGGGCAEGERRAGRALLEIEVEETVEEADAGDADASAAGDDARRGGDVWTTDAADRPAGESCECGAAFTEDSLFCRRCGARRFVPSVDPGAAVAAPRPRGRDGSAGPASARAVGSSARPKAVQRSQSSCLPRAPSAPASRPQTPKTPRWPPARERARTPHAAGGPTPARAETRSRRTLGSLPAAESIGACQVDDGLDEAFRAFCGPGQSGMDGKTFAKLCKDGRLADRGCTTTDLDLIFARVAPKGRRRLGLRQFREALRLVAEKKGVDAAETVSAVAALRGPALRGTKAEAVRFHDDKSTYTGTHAQGGPEAAPLGRGSGTQLAALGMRLGHRN